MHSINCKNKSNTTNNRKDKAKQNQESCECAGSEHMESSSELDVAAWGRYGSSERQAVLGPGWLRAALHSDHTISVFNWAQEMRQPLRRLLFPMKRKSAVIRFHALNLLNAFRKLKSSQKWTITLVFSFVEDSDILRGRGRVGILMCYIPIHHGGQLCQKDGLWTKNFMVQKGSWITFGLFYPLCPRCMRYQTGMADVSEQQGSYWEGVMDWIIHKYYLVSTGLFHLSLSSSPLLLSPSLKKMKSREKKLC